MRRRESAPYRRYPLDALLESQALEGGAQIAATYRDEPDPRPRVKRRLVARSTSVAGDHEHTLTWNIEHQRVEVEAAALRYDDLGRVTRQAERCAQLDQFRMPHRKERLSVNTARAREDRVGGDTRKAFVDQMLVGRATAERGRIGPARVAIPGLDEHQRHCRLQWVRAHQAELASIVQPAPVIADARHA